MELNVYESKEKILICNDSKSVSETNQCEYIQISQPPKTKKPVLLL